MEQKAFISWRASLPPEQFERLFVELCTRLAEHGYLAPPPAGLWSLPEEEKGAYFDAFRELEESERWETATMLVRELWLEAIGVLQPESQNQAETEQEEEQSHG
jgi:hypothetical protein